MMIHYLTIQLNICLKLDVHTLNCEGVYKGKEEVKSVPITKCINIYY